METQTVTLTLTRGPLVIESGEVLAYAVTSDGPFRARGMLWVEAPGTEARVMEASGFQEFLASRG